MKKLGPVAYRTLFFNHLWRFLQSVASARILQAPHAIGVSGGLDSMTLLWVAKKLHEEGKIGPVRAIFVNHNTRSGQKGDGDLVEKFCKQENIPFTRVEIKGLSPMDSNFEAKARKLRREGCLMGLGERESLWVAHHLDDSYEWNFMQRNRSYSPKASIGIPVRNGAIIRPFSCVTRAQIKRLGRFEDIPYRDDPTNWDLRHNRNYIRHLVIPRIKKRFPKYLKFYSYFANFSAMALKVNLIYGDKVSKLYSYEQGAILLRRPFSEIQIQEMIHHYSSVDRGKIITPIERMLRAIENGKKGPFHFSGEIEVSYSTNLLMIYRKGLKNYDEAIAQVLKQLTDEQLNQMPHYMRDELAQSWDNLLKSSDAMLNLPGLVLVLENDSIKKVLNTSVYEQLFPLVSAVCKERGLRFLTYRKCLETWSQKREKLPKKLKLLPLSNLSNLFTFQ